MTQAAADAQSSHHDVLNNVLNEVEDGLDGNDRVSIGDMVTALNDRGFGALCALIGILAATPVIGALPGASLFAAGLILLIAGQQAVGRHGLWIPSFLSERSIDRDKFESGVEKAKQYVGWVDKLVYPRLDWLVEGRTERRLIAAAMCVLALTMIPLALVPWGVFPPALAVAAFGIAILGRDGLFAVAGYGLTAVTVYVLYAFSGLIAGWL
jgi:hypothetical protein